MIAPTKEMPPPISAEKAEFAGGALRLNFNKGASAYVCFQQSKGIQMEWHKSLIVAAAAATVLLANGVPAAAYEQWQLNQKKTYTGIPLDAPIEVEVRGHRLTLPAGYFFDWSSAGTPDMRERKFEKLGIHFWMPGRAYPGFNSVSVVDLRPRYKGQDFDPSTYIVNAVIEYRKLNEAGYKSPWQRSERMLATNLYLERGKAWSFETTSFGLERFWIEGMDPQEDLRYRTRQNENPQAYFECLSTAWKLLNPSCRGYIHFEDGLAFEVEFPPDVLPDWWGIVGAVHDLARSWEQKSLNHE